MNQYVIAGLELIGILFMVSFMVANTWRYIQKVKERSKGAVQA